MHRSNRKRLAAVNVNEKLTNSQKTETYLNSINFLKFQK